MVFIQICKVNFPQFCHVCHVPMNSCTTCNLLLVTHTYIHTYMHTHISVSNTMRGLSCSNCCCEASEDKWLILVLCVCWGMKNMNIQICKRIRHIFIMRFCGWFCGVWAEIFWYFLTLLEGIASIYHLHIMKGNYQVQIFLSIMFHSKELEIVVRSVVG